MATAESRERGDKYGLRSSQAMDIDRQTLGERLERARRGRGWTIETLVAKVSDLKRPGGGHESIGVSTVKLLEKPGYKLPRKARGEGHKLPLLARVLDLDLIELLAACCTEEEIRFSVFGSLWPQVAERLNADRSRSQGVHDEAKVAFRLTPDRPQDQVNLAFEGQPGSAQQSDHYDRFLKALEGLAHPHPAMVAGTAEVLKQIAGESDEMRLVILRLLAIHLRYRSQSLPPWQARSEAPTDFASVVNTIHQLGPHDTYGHKRLDLTGVNLSHLVLYIHQLQGVVLTEANCFKTFFNGADLTSCSFYRADLRSAEFCGASLGRARFEEAILDGTDLRHVDLRRVRDLTKTQLATALTDSTTLLPDWDDKGVSISIVGDTPQL
jgi:hypothetical protein